MYGWLWRKLPGGTALKLLQSLAMLGVVGVVLIGLVFPWVEPKLPFSDNTVDGGGSGSSPTPSATPSTLPVPSSTDVPTPGADVLPGD